MFQYGGNVFMRPSFNQRPQSWEGESAFDPTLPCSISLEGSFTQWKPSDFFRPSLVG